MTLWCKALELEVDNPSWLFWLLLPLSLGTTLADSSICEQTPGACKTQACLQRDVRLFRIAPSSIISQLPTQPQALLRPLIAATWVFDPERMRPRNGVEAYVAYHLQQHVDSLPAVKRGQSAVAEYWMNRDLIGTDTCNLHYDKDEHHRGKHEFHVAPDVSMITYLTGSVQPTLVLPIIKCPPSGRCPNFDNDKDVIPTGESWIAVVFPEPGVQLRFDGRFLHGICGENFISPSSRAPPDGIHNTLAAKWLAAVRMRYILRQDDAVEHFLKNGSLSPEVQSVLESFEKEIADSAEQKAAVKSLAYKWGLTDEVPPGTPDKSPVAESLIGPWRDSFVINVFLNHTHEAKRLPKRWGRALDGDIPNLTDRSHAEPWSDFCPGAALQGDAFREAAKSSPSPLLRLSLPSDGPGVLEKIRWTLRAQGT